MSNPLYANKAQIYHEDIATKFVICFLHVLLKNN